MGFRRWTGHLERECPHVDLQNIEWKTKRNVATMPYGLLIRPFAWGLNPREYASPVDAKCAWRRTEEHEEAQAKVRAVAHWPADARARVAELEAEIVRLAQQAKADKKESNRLVKQAKVDKTKIAQLKARLGGKRSPYQCCQG